MKKAQSLQKPILTRRMKWIIKQMREHGAIIQEQGHEVEVTEKMYLKLIKAGLIKSIENNPVYDKSGKFVTTESVYGLAEAPE